MKNKKRSLKEKLEKGTAWAIITLMCIGVHALFWWMILTYVFEVASLHQMMSILAG